MRLILTILAFVGIAAAQCQQTPGEPPNTARFILTYSSTGTSEVLTVQQPAAGADKVTMECAYVYCANACTVQFSMDGTAATATVLAPLWISGSISAATGAANKIGPITGWRSSNVGAGTVLSPTFNISAGTGQTFTLSAQLTKNSTANNFSMTIAGSPSGSIQAFLQGRNQ